MAMVRNELVMVFVFILLFAISVALFCSGIYSGGVMKMELPENVSMKKRNIFWKM